MVSPHDDPIELVESRHSSWRERFESERDRLEELFDRCEFLERVRRIEHVGSTAVPGLAAKDIVDLDIVVDDDVVADVAVAIESKLGGTRYENGSTWHPVFRRADGQRFNDHVFGHSGPGWRISVATVEVLRTRSDLRKQYEQLKRKSASETDDLERYGRAKSAFITDLLDHAGELEFDFEIPSLKDSDGSGSVSGRYSASVRMLPDS